MYLAWLAFFRQFISTRVFYKKDKLIKQNFAEKRSWQVMRGFLKKVIYLVLLIENPRQRQIEWGLKNHKNGAQTNGMINNKKKKYSNEIASWLKVPYRQKRILTRRISGREVKAEFLISHNIIGRIHLIH